VAIDDFRGAVVIVTHSEMILHELATRLIVFDDGKVTLFEGTYQEFLDRVGWKNEETAVRFRAPVSGRARPSGNRKHLRRIRAGLINERSRTLGALQRKIDEIESEIIRLEEKADQDHDDLIKVIKASVAGNAETIGRLSKALHDSKSEIESLFSALESLHSDLDSTTKEFEKKLNAVEI